MPFVQYNTPADRLATKSIRSGACLLWTGHRMPNGYGVISVGGQRFLVHRLAYELVSGEIPYGLLVWHTCDTRNCIEPTHLIPGTHAQNTADMMARDRSRKHTQLVCANGHPRTEEFRHITGRGAWDCKPCREKRTSEQWQRQKAKKIKCPHCNLVTTTNYMLRHTRRKHLEMLVA